jgi:hypothetical protein
MRCDEYLQLLSTLPVEELTDGRSGDHLGSCAECNRATRVVVERERNMVLALAGMSSGVHPLSTTQSAIALARRRRIGRWYMAGLVVLLIAIGSSVVSRFVFPIETSRGMGEEINQNLRPQCLSLTAAADLLRQQVPSRTLRITMRLGSSVLWVSGTPQDLMRARSVLDRYDNPTASTCVVPQPGTLVPEYTPPGVRP